MYTVGLNYQVKSFVIEKDLRPIFTIALPEPMSPPTSGLNSNVLSLLIDLCMAATKSDYMEAYMICKCEHIADIVDRIPR